jgi:hypothetical protein
MDEAAPVFRHQDGTGWQSSFGLPEPGKKKRTPAGTAIEAN